MALCTKDFSAFDHALQVDPEPLQLHGVFLTSLCLSLFIDITSMTFMCQHRIGQPGSETWDPDCHDILWLSVSAYNTLRHFMEFAKMMAGLISSYFCTIPSHSLNVARSVCRLILTRSIQDAPKWEGQALNPATSYKIICKTEGKRTKQVWGLNQPNHKTIMTCVNYES